MLLRTVETQVEKAPIDTIGLVRGDTWLLRNSNTPGGADMIFYFGDVLAGDIPITGDWDGDGDDTAGLVRGNTWLLRNQNSSGPPTLNFDYGIGIPGDWPVPNDWDADGDDTPGVAEPRDATIVWSFGNLGGPGQVVFSFI